MQFSEISVTAKDEEKSLNKKFTVYDQYYVNENDPTIKSCVDEVLKNFDGNPDKVKITITLEL